MSYIKRIFKYVAYFILVILVSLSLYTFVATDILKNDYADIFGYTYFVVKTGSMSGTLEVNDVIFVKLGQSPKIGDIVSYKSDEGEIVTHRLIRKIGDKLITQGDVNNSADKPISKDLVIGVVKGSVSPKFLLKSIAVFLLVFIFLSLINFDVIIRKYIFKDKEIVNDKNDNKLLDKTKDFNIKILLEEVNKLFENKEEEILDDIEILDYEDGIENNDSTLNFQKQFLSQVVNLLKIKNDNFEFIKINNEWILKYQFIYKIANILMINDMKELTNCVNHVGFKELYDYDLEEIGLCENLRNKIYDMPIYMFLEILFFALLYGDDSFFDGIYKIMKYKVSIDKKNYFNTVLESDEYGRSQLRLLIYFMKKTSIKFDDKNVFNLEKIEEEIKIKNYINK